MSHSDDTSRIHARAVREAYDEATRQRDRDLFPFNYLIVRPLSFPLAAWFLRSGMNAMQVTFLGLWVLLLGLFLVILPAFPGVSVTVDVVLSIVGALFINIWFILDDVDGSMARFAGTSSSRGALADSVTGQLYHVLTPIAVGLFLWRTETRLFSEPLYFLVAGLSLAVVIAGRIGISRTISLKIPPTQGSYSRPGNIARIGYLIEGLKAPLLLVFSGLQVLPLWLLVIGVLETALYLRTIARAYKKR